MPRLALGSLLWLVWFSSCKSKVYLRGKARYREHLSAATPSCNCKHCLGQRKITDTPTSGFKGFQCKPRASGVDLGYCKQTGDQSTWVVQSAPRLTYERFCYFTCKPLIPKQITPDIDCAQLSPQEAKLGQSQSGNGRAFIWHSNPITDSVTLSQLKFPAMEVPDVSAKLLEAMTQVKDEEARKAAAAAERAKLTPKLPSPPKAGFCMCKCPAPVTTTGPLPPYNPFKTPPPLPAAPPKPPGVPPPPPPPPVPPPPLPGPPPLPPLPLVLPAPVIGGPTPYPPPPPTLQPTPPPPPTTTFDWSSIPVPTTTEPVPYFDHPFPDRFAGEAPWKKPLGPFAPTFAPGVPFLMRFMTTTYGAYRPYGAAPAPGPAPMGFGFGTTPAPMGYGFGTTPAPVGFGFGTTRWPYVFLDASSAEERSPVDDGLPADGISIDTTMPPMELPPMVMPGMPPIAFLQENSELFRSDKPISGCNCQCASHDKHEEAVMAAQRNAMSMAEFPEDHVDDS